eukprot:7521554-Lingulodinium_polyedra.AAC.1
MRFSVRFDRLSVCVRRGWTSLRTPSVPPAVRTPSGQPAARSPSGQPADRTASGQPPCVRPA